MSRVYLVATILLWTFNGFYLGRSKIITDGWRLNAVKIVYAAAAVVVFVLFATGIRFPS